MKNFSNIGVALSNQQMKQVIGGYDEGGMPVLKPYWYDVLKGPKPEINCWALADTMRNT